MAPGEPTEEGAPQGDRPSHPSQRPRPPEPRPIDVVVEPLRGLAVRSESGAVVLLLAALVAVLWASSPFKVQYFGWLQTTGRVGIGDFVLEKTISHWINDGLMGVFFFTVGLEIKREILAGELSSLRRAALPAVAALGGMLVPAGFYVALTGGGDGIEGWGIPMATDIAFALGILSLAIGSGAPTSLKVFLTGLAIADDIGAVIVIAVFYTEQIALGSLLVGAVVLGVAMACNRLGVRSMLAYLALGTALWLAFLSSGVHATLAALLMAFAIPARTRFTGRAVVDNLGRDLEKLEQLDLPADHGLNREDHQRVLDAMTRTLLQASAPLQRLEQALGPAVAFVVLPAFALANAGIDLGALSTEALQDRVTLGVAAGLLLGKPLGIVGACWLAVRLGVAELPRGASFRHLLGVGLLAGVGFTMSLFISDLAFDDAAKTAAARLGILGASTLAGLGGYLWLRHGCRPAA